MDFLEVFLYNTTYIGERASLLKCGRFTIYLDAVIRNLAHGLSVAKD